MPTECICIECKTRFTARNRTRKYCSEDCRIRFNNRMACARARKLHEVSCEHCGKVFMQHNGNQKFCDPECQKAAARARARAKYRTDTAECPICGAEFHKTKGKIYCSPECKEEQRKAKRREFRKQKRSGEVRIDPYYLRRGDPNAVSNGTSMEGSLIQ